MRIAAVCPYSLSVPGGVQHQVLGLAREVRLLGHEVDVIAPCDGEPPTGAVSVGRSYRFRVNGSSAPMAPTPAAAARTIRVLASGRYDILHLHEPLAPSITIAALLAHSAPIVGTFHAAGDSTPYRWFGPPLKLLARRIDARVAVSPSASDLVGRHLGGRCEVLFNGVEASIRAAAFPEPSVAAAPPNILFVGRHDPRKGLEVLLQAMAGLPGDVVLRVAGDGPDRARLQARFAADARIQWLGRISEADKIQHLRAASVVCVPSLFGESFGIVILEAMAVGTPVIASDLPGYRQLTANGTAAVLVAPSDPIALADAVVRLRGDQGLRDRMPRVGDRPGRTLHAAEGCVSLCRDL